MFFELFRFKQSKLYSLLKTIYKEEFCGLKLLYVQTRRYIAEHKNKIMKYYNKLTSDVIEGKHINYFI